MQDLIQFYDAHYLVVWAVAWLLLSALFNVLTRFKTPEKWVEFGENYPRVQNVIRLMRALGIDPVKAIKSLGDFLTGKATSTQPDRPPVLKDVKTDKEN